MLDLLDAFRQDQRKTRYETIDELDDYCRRSANPVGHLLLEMAGCRKKVGDERSDAICTALQLANHLQDTRRDFEAGRIYLPNEVWQRHAVSESDFVPGETSANLRAAIEEESRRARQLFDEGASLPTDVPRWLATDLEMFIAGGRATLDAIEAIGFDVMRVRPTVSKWKQARLLGGVLVRRYSPFG
ncbi:MAG: squalene/phytoene synthase family protein, partial [Planctomycetota bacterium]